MSINLSGEQLKTFAQAAHLLPRRRGDRPVHPTTLWRWYRHGVVHAGQRLYLEALKTPSGMTTTAEALQRFLTALNSHSPLAGSSTTRQAVNAAVEQLDADGI